MKLIKGSDLTQEQKKQVLSAFIYRWTTGNTGRERVWANVAGKPKIALQTDHDWLNEHAFWFINNGSQLAARKHAEPHYLADN